MSDEAEFFETLARVAQDIDHGQNPRPAFDAQLHREVVAECVHGRRIEDYRHVLEATGFRYYPPHKLPLWVNGQLRTDGEWRNNALRLAFTNDDVTSKFENPEAFFTWLQDWTFRRRAARAGIILAGRR